MGQLFKLTLTYQAQSVVSLLLSVTNSDNKSFINMQWENRGRQNWAKNPQNVCSLQQKNKCFCYFSRPHKYCHFFILFIILLIIVCLHHNKTKSSFQKKTFRCGTHNCASFYFQKSSSRNFEMYQRLKVLYQIMGVAKPSTLESPSGVLDKW